MSCDLSAKALRGRSAETQHRQGLEFNSPGESRTPELSIRRGTHGRMIVCLSRCKCCKDRRKYDRWPSWNLHRVTQSKGHPQSYLQGSWIGNGRHLLKRRDGIRGIRARSKVTVQSNAIHMIEEVKRFQHRFYFEAFTHTKCPAQSCIDIEVVETRSCITTNECSIDRGPRRGPLNGVGSRRDIEWQGRVILNHRPELKVVGDFLE